jgi:hypothetical protein
VRRGAPFWCHVPEVLQTLPLAQSRAGPDTALRHAAAGVKDAFTPGRGTGLSPAPLARFRVYFSVAVDTSPTRRLRLDCARASARAAERRRRVSHDVDGASGDGCLGWYSPSSPPPGSRIAVRRPKPSSSTGPGISAPRALSSATVALRSSHIR